MMEPLKVVRRDAVLAATWLSPGGSHTPHSPPPSLKRPWSGWLYRRRSSSPPKVCVNALTALCVEWQCLQFGNTVKNCNSRLDYRSNVASEGAAMFHVTSHASLITWLVFQRRKPKACDLVYCFIIKKHTHTFDRKRQYTVLQFMDIMPILLC